MLRVPMSAPKILVVGGTRPEALKLAPLVRMLGEPESPFSVQTCFSGQHQELLQSVLYGLPIRADIKLPDLPRHRTLAQTLILLLDNLDQVLFDSDFDGVVVQGDTHTTLAGAMAAYNNKIPCFHVEAGLRTNNPYLPFPEEMNRRQVSRLAALHFAPTQRAQENLLAEGIPQDTVFVTGNTVVDALQMYVSQENPRAQEILEQCQPNTRRLLVTLHRRENLDRVSQVTRAVRQLLMQRQDIEVMWLLHLNASRGRVLRDLAGHPAVHLFEPQPYSVFVHLMKEAHIVLTDSGGVQEEAPVFGSPTLVLRDETERPEAVEAGCAKLVGCDSQRIVSACQQLLDNPQVYRAMSQPKSPFGDGKASERICEHLEKFYLERRQRLAVGG